MKTYHIRFNTKHGDSDLVWRVFEDGVEHLVKHLQIRAPVYDATTVEDGVVKWNMTCQGNMIISNEIAFIS
jgi:hypothetical protein